MDESTKYLIHVDVAADGVVERSDVVGAIFGQTEGLLGDELDLRHLREASKVGRIDVDVDSEGGRSFGELTIATSLDKVETAVLAAALETIGRVGPCRAELHVTDIEDVRAAKRRAVVERARELVAESFDDTAVSSKDILEEVRQSLRVEDITEYEGLPAGPHVADSDAVVVVEGRADVLTLLEYGIKNAVAVEGTDVPDAIAELTRERTVTAFLDGDRGGDLILKELAQVGSVDYVALAPPGRSVEDLSHHEVMQALREKVPYAVLSEEESAGAIVRADPASSADGGTVAHPDAGEFTRGGDAGATGVEADADATADDADATADDGQSGEAAPATLHDHVRAVVEEASGTVRLLDEAFDVLAEAPAGEVFDAVADAEPAPEAVVLDGELSQRVLDVAAQRGVARVVARETGDFVKRPVGVRVLTAEQLLS